MLGKVFKYLMCGALFVMAHWSYAQRLPAQVGDTLSKIQVRQHFGDRNISILDLEQSEGKWLLLNFWNIHCKGSVKIVAQLEVLQQKFGEELQIVAIDNMDTSDELRNMLERENLQLDGLVHVRSDTLEQLFPHVSVPHHVWIDPDGVIRAITHSNYATPEVVEEILEGRPITMVPKTDKRNHISSSLLKANGSFVPEPFYYSAITPYIPKAGVGIKNVDGSLIYINATLVELLTHAFELSSYVGYQQMVFEVSDSKKDRMVKPRFDSTMEGVTESFAWEEENSYCYTFRWREGMRQSVPQKEWNKIMQQDLANFLRHLLGVRLEWEQREVDCLVLTTYDKVGQEAFALKGGLKSKNMPIENLLFQLELNLKHLGKRIIDGTGMNKDTLISVGGDLLNFENIQNQLKQQGFQLVERRKKFPVLVIKDIDSKIP